MVICLRCDRFRGHPDSTEVGSWGSGLVTEAGGTLLLGGKTRAELSALPTPNGQVRTSGDASAPSGNTGVRVMLLQGDDRGSAETPPLSSAAS